MKIRKLIPLFIVSIIIVGFGVTKVIAQNLPTIITACEYKNGQLNAIDDGFSLLKKCPDNGRLVAIIGEKGDKGDTGEQGIQGEKGEQGEPGTPGFIPSKEVNVCFDVSTGVIKVLQGTTCFPHVRWKIPVSCVTGEPCKPDNPADLYYLTNN